MQLKNIKQITGRVILKSGLHIGAGDMEMHIGGTDNPVVKHPHTLEPYIPGSSLKGKVRALLEMRSGLIGLHGNNGGALSAKVLGKVNGKQKEQAEAILKLFGSSGADGEAAAELGPTRLSFADCNLSQASRDEVRGHNLPLTEVKSENTINRINGTAEHPRFTERVPSGLAFDFAISLKVYDQDNENDLEKFLLDGLKMLEYDALGGSGSRGYGRVEFAFDDEARQKRFGATAAFSS